MKDLIAFVAVAILSQARGETPSSISCISKHCYTVFEIITDFRTALDTCEGKGGHLMTVQSTASNDKIHDLFADVKGEFWIGLRFNNGGCTDVSSALRGYEWITGGHLTDFTSWRSSETICASSCVSVSSDLKWTERPCDDLIDGFLCEIQYDSVCDPLKPEETDTSVHYETPSGIQGEGEVWLPAGSIVTGNPSGVRHICAPGHGWLRAPWSCEVGNGGCEHECTDMKPQHLCSCPPGYSLQSNNVTCAIASNDPCLNLGCEHICVASACLCRDGYELTEDGKGCRDIDECRDKRMCQNLICVNTIGSFECNCPGGFTKEKGICVDVNECLLWPCEHNCSNTQGSYICSCFEKYIQRGDDHTKCELHCDKAECLAECDINMPTQCECPNGFVIDERKTGIFCVDINECNSNHCAMGCKNTFGGYICSCPLGFQLIKGYDCIDDDTGSGHTETPLDVVTPTSNYTDVASAVTPGGLLGIIVCIVFMILILVFLVHRISKRRSTWKTPGEHKHQGEDMQDLQHVTTEKYTKKSSLVNRDLKQDT